MTSVIICTHNPRSETIRRCLAALEAQTVLREKWELILIDNASSPEKAPRPDLSWHPNSQLIREEKLGLTPARLRGIREAVGDLLVFVDDDNVLDADFLDVAIRTAEDKAFLGAWSGQCRPEFEEPPAGWTRRYWGNLVIREFDRDVWSNLPRLAATMPCGAGLCVTRGVARHYLYLHESGERSIQFDRKGGSLLSGGDNDLAACACKVGLSVGLVASLRLTHLVPKYRLTAGFLARLAEGIQYSSTLLDAEYGIRPSPRTTLGRIADCLRLLRLPQPHRQILRAVFRGRDSAVKEITGRKAGQIREEG